MADLAEDTAAAFFALDPALRRNDARVDAIKHHQRAGSWLERVARRDEQRRKTPVEADRQDARRVPRGLDAIVEAGSAFDRERLFAEHMLACAQGARREPGVGVVAGGNENSVGRRILDRGGRIGRRASEAELLLRMVGADAGLGDDALEPTPSASRTFGSSTERA